MASSSGIPSEKIMTIVNSIRESKVEDKAKHFENIYGNFKKKYPKLYEKACSNNEMDIVNLQFMMNMLNNINSENMSQYDASAQVGQMLYDKYIHENIKDLPPTKK
jgi:hypothetical protein